MNWMSKKDKQINFKRKFSDLNKLDTFSHLNKKRNPNLGKESFKLNQREKFHENSANENKDYYKVVSKYYIF